MYCSKCGLAVSDDQEFCSGCGQRLEKSLPIEAALAAERSRFDRTIQRLSLYWYLFAGLNFALGLAGLIGAQMGASALAGPYEPWPHPPIWNWTLAASVVWILLALRTALAAVAAWGLKARTEWSRPIAITAGAVAISQFPIGLVLGVYTIAVLTGKHHAAMYAHQA